MKSYLGTYAGRVVAANDPSQVGQIKVRCPILHGLVGGQFGIIDDVDLPWALPAGMPSGGSSSSGGQSWLPVVGDQVWVRFLDGQLAKPVWEWGNQNLPQIKSFGSLPLHAYDEFGQPVKRSALSRYNHWQEFIPTGIKLWSKSLYTFEIKDGDTSSKNGSLTLSTPLGNFLTLEDAGKSLTLKSNLFHAINDEVNLAATKSLSLTTPNATFNFSTLSLSGDYSKFQLDASANGRGFRSIFNALAIESASTVMISCPNFFITTAPISYSATGFPGASSAAFGMIDGKLGLGSSPGDPVVRMSDLIIALQSVKKIFDSHTHVNSGGEGNSGLPAVPAIYMAAGSQLVLVEQTPPVTKTVGI